MVGEIPNMAQADREEASWIADLASGDSSMLTDKVKPEEGIDFQGK